MRTGIYLLLHKGIRLVRLDHLDDGPIQWWDVRGCGICQSAESLLNNGARMIPLWLD